MLPVFSLFLPGLHCQEINPGRDIRNQPSSTTPPLHTPSLCHPLQPLPNVIKCKYIHQVFFSIIIIFWVKNKALRVKRIATNHVVNPVQSHKKCRQLSYTYCCLGTFESNTYMCWNAGLVLWQYWHFLLDISMANVATQIWI